MPGDRDVRRATALTLAIAVMLSVGGSTLVRRSDPPGVSDPRPAASPSPRACVSTMTGDFDGDGRADVAAVSARDGSACVRARRGAFRLVITTASGERITRTVAACRATCRIIGTPDFNGDLRDELLLQLSLVRGHSIAGVFSLDGDRIERARTGHDPAVFRIGGGLSLRNWLSCTDEDGRRIVQRLHAQIDPETTDRWFIQRTRLLFDGVGFVTLGLEEYTLAVDDPRAFELGGSGNEEVCGPA